MTFPAHIPVYVINLPDDAKRRQDMHTRFDPLGVPLTFIEAVRGRNLSADETAACYDSARRRKYFVRDLLPAEIGCILSHKKIYEKMVREGVQKAVILEDDVIPEQDFTECVNTLDSTPIKWDIVRFLGSQKVYKRGHRKIAQLGSGCYWLVRLPTTPGGSHGYMITRHGAEIMLKYMQRNWLPIDGLLGRLFETGLETLSTYPAPVQIDEEVTTTIGDERFDKTIKETGLRKLQFIVHRGLYRLSDTLGKRYVYWSSYTRDHKNSKLSRKCG